MFRVDLLMSIYFHFNFFVLNSLLVVQRKTFKGNPHCQQPPLHTCSERLRATHWPCKFNNMASELSGTPGVIALGRQSGQELLAPWTKGPVFPPPPAAPPLSVVISGNRGSLQCKSSVNEAAQAKGGDLLWINLIRLECPSPHSPVKVTSRLLRSEETERFHSEQLIRTSMEFGVLSRMMLRFISLIFSLFYRRCTSA